MKQYVSVTDLIEIIAIDNEMFYSLENRVDAKFKTKYFLRVVEKNSIFHGAARTPYGCGYKKNLRVT